jgi:hypothetical protein
MLAMLPPRCSFAIIGGLAAILAGEHPETAAKASLSGRFPASPFLRGDGSSGRRQLDPTMRRAAGGANLTSPLAVKAAPPPTPVGGGVTLTAP